MRVKNGIIREMMKKLSDNIYNKRFRQLSKIVLVISIVLCVVFLFVYVIEPDFCAAVTFWPVYIWAILGIFLSLAAIGVDKKWRLIAAIFWIILVCFIAEEPLSILRTCIFSGKSKGIDKRNYLRITSLNCAGGNPDAAEELFQYAPDIVLLQESPASKDLEILVKKLFPDGGEFVFEGDTAILARGHVIKSAVNRENRLFMTEATVSLPSGLAIETLSVHLTPPATGIDLFSLDCWREHIEDRKHRIKQITVINEQLEPIADDVSIIVGGDFNANPWRGATKILSSRLYDTFKKGGTGWPGTGPSHFPLWRVDQIWTSRQFKTVNVHSEHCKNSDHRIVICDLAQ